jgi:hypothetical protein
MAEPLEGRLIWRTIEVTIDGRVVRGSWAHDGLLVQVRSPHGDKTTQISSSPPLTLAKQMLRELAKEGKA